MDVAHGIGPAEIQQVVVAAHLAIPGVEARAAIAFFVELERLDHGAHGAVEHQDTPAQQLGELFARVAHHAASCVAGRKPSKWQMA